MARVKASTDGVSSTRRGKARGGIQNLMVYSTVVEWGRTPQVSLSLPCFALILPIPPGERRIPLLFRAVYVCGRTTPHKYFLRVSLSFLNPSLGYRKERGSMGDGSSRYHNGPPQLQCPRPSSISHYTPVRKICQGS